MNSKKNLVWQLAIGIVISVGISLFLGLTSFIPTGNDIFGHLYKAEILYDNLKVGNLYPLYTTEWYNGIQLFRYWPIFTYYIIAFINFLTRDIFVAYYVYVGLTFFVSYLGFVLIANREKKGIFILIGIVYWFLPDCLRVLFGEGNLSRVMIYALLPLFFYFYTNLLEKKKHFVVTSLMMALLVSTHFMLAAMCAIIFTIYGFFKGLKNKTQWYGFWAIVVGILIAGILLLPGLSGGLVSDSSSAAVDTIEDWSQPLYVSLNPFARMLGTNCSFGLGAFLIGVIGLIVAIRRKEEKSGFIVGLIFFILSDSMFTDIFKQMPMSQVFWMARFAQMCYVLILYDFGRLEWKPYLKYILVGVAIVDIIPSMAFWNAKTDLTYLENIYLLEESVEITQNRMGLVDESSFGSYPSYYMYKAGVPYIQGWAIQGAGTGENIITMTESVQQGYYGYTFHQLLTLGADSAIVKKSFVQDKERFLQVAAEYGYVLVQESSDSYLLDLEGVEGTFGVQSEFNSLAIGSSSIYISYLYPGFEQGRSDCLTDYTMEELLQYDKIYLSNFEYDDVQHAEEMVQALSDSDVEVFIDCTHMPINVLSISEFLGVESRFISISEFERLYYGDMTVDLEMPYEWYSTYLVPVEDGDMERYTYQFGNQTLDYVIKKDNITFVGFNLVYLYYDTPNDELLTMLDTLFGITEADRRVVEAIVPIGVEYGRNEIIVHTDEAVNTTIAFQDNFRSKQSIDTNDNMLIVGPGTTTVNIYYKHLLPGLLCSLFGIVFMFVIKRKLIKRQEG